MVWIILVVAGLFEVGWATCLKYSRGFTRPWPTVGFIAFMAISVYLLGLALKSLPLGTAYTVWTGIGAVGSVAVGIFVFGESADWPRLACIALIATGILGLRFLSPH